MYQTVLTGLHYQMMLRGYSKSNLTMKQQK